MIKLIYFKGLGVNPVSIKRDYKVFGQAQGNEIEQPEISDRFPEEKVMSAGQSIHSKFTERILLRHGNNGTTCVRTASALAHFQADRKHQMRSPIQIWHPPESG